MKMKSRTKAHVQWALLIGIVLFSWGCAHHQSLPRESYQLAFKIEGGQKAGPTDWAPVFIVYGHSHEHNRIGRPTVALDDDGKQRVFIDTEDPVAYFLKRSFQTERAAYTNLIYRVHFPGTPYSLVPFNLTAGRNVGLMVVVTLNADNLPVLVTTVHTCGCYKAIVPTQYLPEEALPRNWNGERLKVYGEVLPPGLKFSGVMSPQITLHLRPEVHRVMDLEVRESQSLEGDRIRGVLMQMEPMARLERLPTGDGFTSFFHEDGIQKGHVKGSVKPLETLFMSLISLDLFVGTDKAYSDPAISGNRFYTSLKPWRRKDSDMWDFAGFLWYWGWRL